MKARIPRFEHPSNLTLKTLTRRLQERFSVRVDPLQQRQRRYFDTFDWRLAGAGVVLSVDLANEPHELRWERLDGTLVRRTFIDGPLPAPTLPLPTGPFRDELTPHLGPRVLLPLVDLCLREHRLRFVDEDGKTTVRLVAAKEVTARQPGSEGAHRLQDSLNVVPVKGYGAAHEALCTFLREGLSLIEVEEDQPFVKALGAFGRTPGDYASKITLPLDPAMRADEATHTLLLALLNQIERNEDGLRANLDIEFLHDFRVAIRRTRTVLGELKTLFPASVLQHFRTEFKWMGDITSPLRDLDVYLIQLDDYNAQLPASMEGNLNALGTFLSARQKQEHQRLVETLKAPRYRKLLQAWRAFLTAPLAPADAVPEAARPIVEVVSRRIWRRYRRAIKLGNLVISGRDPEAFHEQRLVCKKLRYLMELFQNLYPPLTIRALIKTLKRFQDTLGDIQDYAVQQQMLTSFAHQMGQEGKIPIDTLLTMGWLSGYLNDCQHETQAHFAEEFGRFAQPKEQRRFRRLFNERRHLQPISS